MTIKLDEFFQNPTWMSAIVATVFIIANVVIVIFQTRNNKKSGSKFVSAIEKLSDKIQILLDKEINTVNLQNAENIICSTLRKTEALIKDEVRRVFYHNNRQMPARQKIIRKALLAATQTAHRNDVNTLSKFYYKEQSLAEFLSQIDTVEFVDVLLKFIFNDGKAERDLQDTIYYIESSFNTYITNAKSFYSKL